MVPNESGQICDERRNQPNAPELRPAEGYWVILKRILMKRSSATSNKKFFIRKVGCVMEKEVQLLCKHRSGTYKQKCVLGRQETICI